MRYLLDTHALIWYFEDSSNLPERVAVLIDNSINEKYICSASLWEIAIKTTLGKLKMDLSFDELLIAIMSSDLNILQIENGYLREIANLPFLHKDPFDRLIIATAITESMTIISIDENIQEYDVSWIW